MEPTPEQVVGYLQQQYPNLTAAAIADYKEKGSSDFLSKEELDIVLTQQ